MATAPASDSNRDLPPAPKTEPMPAPKAKRKARKRNARKSAPKPQEKPAAAPSGNAADHGARKAVGAPAAPSAKAPAKGAQRKARKPSSAKRPRAKKATTTLTTLAARYLQHLEGEGRSASTVASYRADLATATAFLGVDTPVGDLTAERVAEYFESDAVMRTRSGMPKAEPTFKKTRRVLRLALCYAVEEGLLQQAPLPGSAK